ncbi:MAG: DUF5063 domain-containing protein [Sedimenticola sp.]
MNLHTIKLSEIAKAYCSLIESVENTDSDWLSRMAELLPQLHAAVDALGVLDDQNEYLLAPDLDSRFEMYTELRRLLGQRDSYWMEFDVAQDGQNMTGSLADDLTDIYCELKYGLGLFEHEPIQAYDTWRSGYRLHWGRHLLDAERHLYELDSRNML